MADPKQEGQLVEGPVVIVADPTTQPPTKWRISRQARTIGNLTAHAVQLSVFTAEGQAARVATFPLAIAMQIGDGISAMAESGLVPDGQS